MNDVIHGTFVCSKLCGRLNFSTPKNGNEKCWLLGAYLYCPISITQLSINFEQNSNDFFTMIEIQIVHIPTLDLHLPHTMRVYRVVKRRANSDDKWSWYQVFSVATAPHQHCVCAYTYTSTQVMVVVIVVACLLARSLIHSPSSFLRRFSSVYIWLTSPVSSQFYPPHFIHLQSLFIFVHHIKSSYVLCCVYSSSTYTHALVELVFSS